MKGNLETDTPPIATSGIQMSVKLIRKKILTTFWSVSIHYNNTCKCHLFLNLSTNLIVTFRHWLFPFIAFHFVLWNNPNLFNGLNNSNENKSSSLAWRFRTKPESYVWGSNHAGDKIMHIALWCKTQAYFSDDRLHNKGMWKLTFGGVRTRPSLDIWSSERTLSSNF